VEYDYQFKSRGYTIRLAITLVLSALLLGSVIAIGVQELLLK